MTQQFEVWVKETNEFSGAFDTIEEARAVRKVWRCIMVSLNGILKSFLLSTNNKGATNEKDT